MSLSESVSVNVSVNVNNSVHFLFNDKNERMDVQIPGDSSFLVPPVLSTLPGGSADGYPGGMMEYRYGISCQKSVF